MEEKKYEYSPMGMSPPAAATHEPVNLWKPYIAASVASFSVVVVGYCMVWTSPASLILRDPLLTVLPEPITPAQEALVGSIFTIGAMFGPFISSPLATWLGRKWCLMLTAVPFFFGLVLVAMANNIMYLYAARLIWGFGSGMVFTVSPMYCAEVATVQCRGALGSFLQLFITIGFLIMYSLGSFISYTMIAIVGMVLVAIFVVSFFFMPESPKYLMLKDKREAAAASLMVLRGQSRAAVEDELNELAEEIHASSSSRSASFRDIFSGGNLKAIYITCVLLAFQQLCGITAVLFYLSTIFTAAGSSLNPGAATTIIGLVQFFASLGSSAAVERLGRKLLLLISSGGTTVGLIALAQYFYWDHIGSPLAKSLSFLPIVSLVVYVVTYCLGLGPMPWTLLSELLPMEIKSIASPIPNTFVWISCFAVTSTFGPLCDYYGNHVVFWGCAVCCALCFLFTMLVVPETKGKTALEIEEMLAGRKTSKKQDNA